MLSVANAAKARHSAVVAFPRLSLHFMRRSMSSTTVMIVANETGEKETKEVQEVQMPLNAVRYKAVRASGPGGQNVNKVATCVEARLNVFECWWLPRDVRERLLQQQESRCTKNGDLIIRVQNERTQHRNKKIAFERIKAAIADALVEPKIREFNENLTEESKKGRRRTKQVRAEKKQARKVSKKDFFL